MEKKFTQSSCRGRERWPGIASPWPCCIPQTHVFPAPALQKKEKIQNLLSFWFIYVCKLKIKIYAVYM